MSVVWQHFFQGGKSMSRIQDISNSPVQNLINPNQDTKTESVSRKETNNVFGGDLKLGTNDLIDEKRENAKKQAMGLISSAWSKDNRAAKKIEDMKQLRLDKLDEAREAKNIIADVEKDKATLMDEYGIKPDSQEQKDTELLEKFQDYRGGVCEEPFTKEEVERLKELQNQPRTQYQKDVLELNGRQVELKKTMEQADWQAKSLNGSVNSARIDQLKSQDMLTSQDSANKLLDAANKEILGLLVNQAKDNIDDTLEENQEKAEEAEEKKEEQEDRIEEAKEDKKEQENLLKAESKVDKFVNDISNDHNATSNVAEAQKSIKKILKENDLLDEDLKGIKIDFNY